MYQYLRMGDLVFPGRDQLAHQLLRQGHIPKTFDSTAGSADEMSVVVAAGFADCVTPDAVITSDPVQQPLAGECVERAINRDRIGIGWQCLQYLRGSQRCIGIGQQFQHRHPNRGTLQSRLAQAGIS